MKKLFAVVLVGLSLACASTGGPRHGSATAVVTAHEVLRLAWTTESSQRCGLPTAIADHCITEAKDQQLAEKFALAFKYDADAARLVAALPDGVPTPSQAFDLVAKIYNLVREILADLPKESPKTLALAKAVNDGGK